MSAADEMAWAYTAGLSTTLAERMIGRPLRTDEVVHHVDHEQSNNDPANLQVMTRAEHARLHALERIASGERMEGHFVERK